MFGGRDKRIISWASPTP